MCLQCCLQDDDHFVGLSFVKRLTFKATATSQISKIHSWIPFLNNTFFRLFILQQSKATYFFFFFFFFWGGGGGVYSFYVVAYPMSYALWLKYSMSSHLIWFTCAIWYSREPIKLIWQIDALKFYYMRCVWPLSNQDQDHDITVITLHERLL